VHLLGEHRELHAIWSSIINNKKGYSHHPETLRWKGRLMALYLRHEKLIKELRRRGYRHQINLDRRYAKGAHRQKCFVVSPDEQIKILRKKKCACKV